ncbi:MAG: hypothetical protein QOD71_1389 [Thermoleophilaceae bacterium]|jgi:hypothetical protein|nr:hypothetical protein [Thermoleophilaceae bacterium]
MATAARAVPSGPSHVAVVSFLAARAAPTGGFWIALAGGVALARVAERRGARLGFGASAAAMLETVAIIGPARIGIPLTQAATAPMLGRLEARGWRPLPQILACAAVRLLHNTATTAFFIWVITGGLDAYAGTYDAIGRRLGLEVGSADALALTLAGLLVWAAFASTVQVLVYRRGLESWDRLASHEPDVNPEMQGKSQTREEEAGAAGAPARRFDPRAIALAAGASFVLLLAGTQWSLLAAVSAWLALAWLAARPDRQPIPAGLLFAALLAGGAFVFALGGGLGLDVAARRGARAGLLVLTATWLRGAAGADGLREVSRRVLGRLRRVPAAPEAALVLDQIASEGRLAAAARALEQQLRGVPKQPLAILDAVLHWVVRESSAFEPPPPKRPLSLRARPADALLIVAAVIPAAALAL